MTDDTDPMALLERELDAIIDFDTRVAEAGTPIYDELLREAPLPEAPWSWDAWLADFNSRFKPSKKRTRGRKSTAKRG